MITRRQKSPTIAKVQLLDERIISASAGMQSWDIPFKCALDLAIMACLPKQFRYLLLNV